VTITSQYNCSRVETGMTRLIALIVTQYKVHYKFREK